MNLQMLEKVSVRTGALQEVQEAALQWTFSCLITVTSQ